jgi:hypothetical protein
MFGGKTKLLWQLHDELRERGLSAEECLVVDLSRKSGYFISKDRGLPPKCLLVDAGPGEYLAFFAKGGHWEYMEMYAAGDEPLPSNLTTEKFSPVGNSIAHDVLSLLKQKRQQG